MPANNPRIGSPVNIRKKFYQLYLFLSGLLVPSLYSSKTAYTQFLKTYAGNAKRWLDLGCGHSLLPPWESRAEAEILRAPELIVGLDSDWQALKHHQKINRKVFADIAQLPFHDEAYDILTANMVIEHLADPEVQFSEAARVLKTGGVFLFHTPNGWGYTTVLSRIIPDKIKTLLIALLEGRKSQDVYPTYYKANTHAAISDLAAKTGFRIRELRFLVSDPQFVMVPPIMIFELLLIRLLLTDGLKVLRPNLIVVLEKQEPADRTLRPAYAT